jgi:hypothetical protein
MRRWLCARETMPTWGRPNSSDRSRHSVSLRPRQAVATTATSVKLLILLLLLLLLLLRADASHATENFNITITLACHDDSSSTAFAEAVLLACEQDTGCAEISRSLRDASMLPCATHLAERPASAARERAHCSREALIGALLVPIGAGASHGSVLWHPRAVLAELLDVASVRLGSAGACDRAGAEIVVRSLIHAWSAWRHARNSTRHELCDGGDGAISGEYGSGSGNRNGNSLFVTRMTATATLVASLVVGTLVVCCVSHTDTTKRQNL